MAREKQHECDLLLFFVEAEPAEFAARGSTTVVDDPFGFERNLRQGLES